MISLRCPFPSLTFGVSHDTMKKIGSRDALTSMETITAFARTHRASLTVMEGGEHWFHTEAQMAFLDDWIKEKEQDIS